MESLRILDLTVVDTSNLEIYFSSNLSKYISKENVFIFSEKDGIENPDVLSLSIKNNLLSIECEPLTSFNSYYILFKSTPSYPFVSLNQDAVLPEDGVSNKYIFVAPLDNDNPIKSYLKSYLNGNLYNIEDNNSLVSKHIDALSINFSKALYDIGQTKNENYISFTVENEQKIRGEGGFDRLNEESAYDLLRVGLTPSSVKSNQTIKNIFDEKPFSLQADNSLELLKPGSVDEENVFNINSLILNLKKLPILKVSKIYFILNNSNISYTYDIPKLGYQIRSSRYDANFASSNGSLLENQILLNSEILNDESFSIEDVLNVEVEFEYKNLGKIISPETIRVFSNKSIFRETLPAITKVFNFKNAPIIINNTNSKIGGVKFNNLNSQNPNEPHPAFLNEIEFNLSALPFLPGQYSIDYNTSTIYVYGSEIKKDGTGEFPPTANYTYQLTHKENIDFTYDETSYELSALPFGNLVENEANIYFEYEQVLVPNIDYKISLHKEVLDERVNNNLLALNCIKTQMLPITNVFKLFNETSGEIYTINRWDDERIYFNYINAPKIISQKAEAVSFREIFNEKLFISGTSINSSSLTIAKFKLNNSKIVSGTEDAIGSSINSSVYFSNKSIFDKERYFDLNIQLDDNLNKLQNYNEYLIDYNSGIIYVCVQEYRNINYGSVSYKDSAILTKNKHILSPDNIYYNFNKLSSNNKKFEYSSFSDDLVFVQNLDNSAEGSIDREGLYPYQIFDQRIGVFDGSSVINNLANDVKFIRGIYENNDIKNNIFPLSFSSDDNFNVNTISKSLFTNINSNGSDYSINTDIFSSYISSNLNYEFEIIRVSDNAILSASSFNIIDNKIKIILSSSNNPESDQEVYVKYTISINNLSKVFIDYDKSNLSIDYTYLNDEIIISYEYGDNEIDFRKSKTVLKNDTYYVSYKVGALRQALNSNFGNMLNIDELSEFDSNFDRERYRDALNAALGSFLQGPTIAAIKNIGKSISHIDPLIVESIFSGWSLGNSILNPKQIKTTGSFELLPGKYENGVLINDPSQTISVEASSNLRLEDGTFECNVIPHWNGIDNQSTLDIEIKKNNVSISSNEIFVGSSEKHPNLLINKFSINKNSIDRGTPNMNKDGVFIYYDKDISGNFDRWYINIIDGYVSGTSPKYNINIFSDGKFYDAKSLNDSSQVKLTTLNKKLSIETIPSSVSNYKLTFISNIENYIFDYGEKNSNRFSLYKDVSGYLVFKIIDNNSKTYSISADVSNWKENDIHQVACSWKINSKNNKDEMHLFIDGFEMPNIIKYNQQHHPYLHQKFRTIDVEQILQNSSKDILSSTDLSVIAGSNQVSSLTNFSNYNINIGDSFIINETGFNTSGYLITAISGQQITLNTVMPLTVNNAKFNINKQIIPVSSNIDLLSRFTVSKFLSKLDGYSGVATNNSNVFSSPIDFQSINIKPGDYLKIDDVNYKEIYTILDINNSTLYIDQKFNQSGSNLLFKLYSSDEEIELPGIYSSNPYYSIDKVNDQNNLILLNGVSSTDLLIIKNYGLVFEKVKSSYFVWGDGYENILKTKLPPPISINSIKINKNLLNLNIGLSNSTIIGGNYTQSIYEIDQPIPSQSGRYLEFALSGSNVDFTVPVSIEIYGSNQGSLINESLTFNKYEKKQTTNQYSSIDHIDIVVKPLNATKSGTILSVKEKNNLTFIEGGDLGAAIRYAYPLNHGVNLQHSGSNMVSDLNKTFSDYLIGSYLFISSPSPLFGYYQIQEISNDRKSLKIIPTNASASLPLPNFSNGVYQIFTSSNDKSGFQNGFILLEEKNSPGKPYILNKGLYEIEYFKYLNIVFKKQKSSLYLGSSTEEKNQFNGVLDNVKIYSSSLKDIRIGETAPEGTQSITKNFNLIKAQPVQKNELLNVNFNTTPFENKSNYYINDNNNFQNFGSILNDAFSNNVVINDAPIIISNDGILNTQKEGTIEFWTSPSYDTYNDPNERFYFDAFSAVVEEVNSFDNVSIKINSSIDKILSVKLKNGNNSIDYFAGGSLEIDNSDLLIEEATSFNKTSVLTTKNILQIASVKVVGDLSEKEYFNNGTFDANNKIIYLTSELPYNNTLVIIKYKEVSYNKSINGQIIKLGKKLPNNISKVIVSYIPSGNSGDRLSIFKDKFGYLNFSIIASNIDYVVRAPINWSSDSWHRIKATFKINGNKNSDELKLFIDGYQYSSVLYGSGITFNQNSFVYGSTYIGDGYGSNLNIKFKDSVNTLYIGSDYQKRYGIFSIIDNLKISNISRPGYAPFGEPIDANYNTNLNVVQPVVEDLYTTYLLNFDNSLKLADDFSNLKGKNNGRFDFQVNIFDNFDIVKENAKSKSILQTLIKKLKPATSKVFIKFL